MSTYWQLTVAEFADRANWSGQILKPAQPDTALSEVALLCQTIADFCGQSNWQGELTKQLSNPEFSLTLTTAEFFQLFPWQSNYQAASPQSKSTFESIPAPDNEMSIDNLSNLF